MSRNVLSATDGRALAEYIEMTPTERGATAQCELGSVVGHAPLHCPPAQPRSSVRRRCVPAELEQRSGVVLAV